MKKLSMILLLIAINMLMVNILIAVPRPDSPEYDAWKRDQIKPIPFSVAPNVPASPARPNNGPSKLPGSLLIPLDGTFTLAMAPNDDGYTDELALPFTFSLYGLPYNSCWVNNNGNVTFDYGLYSYTPWGFPSGNNPMLAPFFADVDTRGAGGLSRYKIESNRVIVIWDHVGYFGSHADKLNTFELIFTDGTDPTIGLGNNVAFSYDDMAWTTGDASDGFNGFGGSPATVGNNKGDDVLYDQIGRFDHAGIDYDGVYGNNDGVDWLDGQVFYFNTGTAATMSIVPTSYELALFGIIPPDDADPDGPDTFVYYASYPDASLQTVQIPVGPGVWMGWIYYSSTWHMADVFPVNGPGTIVFSNVPFGAKFQVPFMIMMQPPTLPVELSSFTAVLNAQNYVKLSWVTESETNMNGYNIFRNDTLDYADADFIGYQASTNSSTQHVYSHTDNEVEINSTYYYWLQCVDFNGSSSLYGPQFVRVTGTETPNLPTATALKNAYPNPFKSNTTIAVDVKEGENATITIYNILGQTVMSYSVAAGNHSINWDGRDARHNAVGSGIYFYRLSSPSLNETRKMMIVK